MRNINDYLDAAIEQQQLGSDRQLSQKLGLAGGAVHHFRTAKAFPSDTTMVKLADLSGQPREQALLELSYWRADGEAQTVYKSLLQKVSGVVVLLTVIFCLGFSNTSSAASLANHTPSVMQNYTLSHLYCGFSGLIPRRFYRSPFVALTVDFGL